MARPRLTPPLRGYANAHEEDDARRAMEQEDDLKQHELDREDRAAELADVHGRIGP